MQKDIMSSLSCLTCGFRTFAAFAQKRDGKLTCPQCGSFYENIAQPPTPQNIPTPKFKFKTPPSQQIP